MEKTSFHFPVVLLYIVAVYLLSAALWTAEGTGGTSGGTDASHLLDGKTFVTQTGEKGKKTDHEDIISFRDGRFISEGCVKYGFEEKSFTASADGGGTQSAFTPKMSARSSGSCSGKGP